MPSNPRRAARDQKLPLQEAKILNQLDPTDQKMRAKDLYDVGWTLRAIGEALYPPRSRSTVRSWITSALPPRLPLPLEPPTHPILHTDPVYIPKKTPSPGISAPERALIRTLAPQARQFRSKMASGHPAAAANEHLTRLTRDLHEKGVPVRELADAAGVTYRAMARRLGKTK